MFTDKNILNESLFGSYANMCQIKLVRKTPKSEYLFGISLYGIMPKDLIFLNSKFEVYDFANNKDHLFDLRLEFWMKPNKPDTDISVYTDCEIAHAYNVLKRNSHVDSFIKKVSKNPIIGGYKLKKLETETYGLKLYLNVH